MLKVCGFCVQIPEEIWDFTVGVVLSCKRWAQIRVNAESWFGSSRTLSDPHDHFRAKIV